MGGHSWSRRAEEFDALIAGLSGDQAAYAELLDVVGALRAVEAPVARPEFVSSLRTQLVAAAERGAMAAEADLETRLTPRQRSGARERRLAALVGGLAVVGATGSMAMASQSALPGDVLYPVKRAIENAQTNLQSDDAGKAESLIEHAQARLDEVEELAARNGDADQISATLEDFTQQANQAADLALDDYASSGESAPVTALRNFAATGMDQLTALGDKLPESARPVLITATQTLRQVDQAAWQLCPVCADGGVAELPAFATQSLTTVLDDNPTGATTTTKPDKAAIAGKPTSGPSAGESSSSSSSSSSGDVPSAGSTAPAQQAPTVKPPQAGLGNTLDGVIRDDLGIDGKPGLGPVKPADGSTPTDPVTGIVDSVTGLLNGLLGQG